MGVFMGVFGNVVLWAFQLSNLENLGFEPQTNLDAINPISRSSQQFAPVSKEPRKRIRDTKVGQWLLNSAPKVLDVVGDALPDTGVMGVVKNLVDRDPNVTHEQRMELENLITSERIALEAELTKRWQSDNASDSWLAKHTRPIIVLSLVVVLFIFIVLDSMDIAFEVRDAWVTLYEVLVVTAVGGYFTLRSVYDKRNKPRR